MAVNTSNGTMCDGHRSLTKGEDVFVIAAWSALATYGLTSNIAVQIAIFTSRRLRTSSPYWLIASLSVCDTCMLLVSFVLLFPPILLRTHYYAHDGFVSAFSVTLYNMFWYTGVLHLLLMAVNRYVNICRSKLYAKYFNKPRTTLQICGTYIGGTAVAAPGLHHCCYVIWDYDLYSARYTQTNSLYTYADVAMNAGALFVMCVCYGRILVKVRKSRLLMQKYRQLYRNRDLAFRRLLNPRYRSHRRRSLPGVERRWRTFRRTIVRRQSSTAGRLPFVARREVRLFVQFAAVSLVFLVSTGMWQWLARTSSSKWSGFIVTSLFLINNSINPTVYLIFNSTMRAQLRRLVCPQRETLQKPTSKVNCRGALFIPTDLTTGVLVLCRMTALRIQNIQCAEPKPKADGTRKNAMDDEEQEEEEEEGVEQTCAASTSIPMDRLTGIDPGGSVLDESQLLNVSTMSRKRKSGESELLLADYAVLPTNNKIRISIIEKQFVDIRIESDTPSVLL